MKGIVLNHIRRKISVFSAGQYFEILIERKYDHLLPGDIIEFSQQEVLNLNTRSNVLKRSYQDKTKEIVANLNILFIITAPSALFNTTVIDRLICTAELEGITPCLILNKSDLGYSDLKESINYYQSIQIPTIKTTAKGLVDINELESYLVDMKPQISAFAGVSGVGKSSLLKALMPAVNFRTNEVSDKTGQGRQTTTLAEGYCYSSDCLIFDLPGIQNFGLSHLKPDLVQHGFRDILNISSKCKFSSSCRHLKEPGCAVKQAVTEKSLLQSRYDSYLQLLDEVVKANSY